MENEKNLLEEKFYVEELAAIRRKNMSIEN